MTKDLCFFIGYFSKVIGLKGEVALKMDVDDPNRYRSLDGIFIQINERDQTLIPFSLEHTQLQNNGTLRVKINGIDDAMMAKEMIGKSAFLPLELLPKLDGTKFYYHEITGFHVTDTEKGNLGTVKQVLEYPSQSVIEIMHESGKEILVPINDQTIVSVDRAGRTLKVTAPEGLIDIYLDPSPSDE